MHRLSLLILVCMVSMLCMPPLTHVEASSLGTSTSFAIPIDGLSIPLREKDRVMQVSGWNGTEWTPWQELHAEDEQDPRLQESNLVLFSTPVQTIRLSENISQKDIHPIRVSHAPAKFTVAALGNIDTPHILSRKEWDADESLLISRGQGTTSADAAGDNGDTVTQPSVREKDCQEMYAKYPQEFKASSIVTENAAGQKLRWPQQYSPSVRLLVVHHTALTVTNDPRSGLERMRALYQYHSVNRGWGDIGYHYVIDEQGQIYEGRAGGGYVVGGHVYCNNIGTIGVALMGNFDKEQPTQTQTQSLQWLLKLLAEKYQINLSRNVIFHGAVLSPIVGHRQLVSTDCPGMAMWSALDQVRDHVRTGNLLAMVTYPNLATLPSPGVTESGTEAIPTANDGLAALSQTIIEGRPGGQIIVPIFFRADRKSYNKNTRIARVTRSKDVQVWQEFDGKFEPVRGDLRIPVSLLKKGQSVVLKVRVGLPATRGDVALKVGSINYTFAISGKRVRSTQVIGSYTTTQLSENPTPQQQSSVDPTSRSSFSSFSSSSRSFFPSSPSLPSLIRILLSTFAGAETATIRATTAPTINGSTMSSTGIRLYRNGNSCALDGNAQNFSGILRITASDGIVGVEANGLNKQYRGTVECRVVDGKFTLINELPMEDYLAGLAEEPDTEPYEKQRAFAIAARTYAQFYVDPAHRKFPGKPYDGSDSPATFQSYAGMGTENTNPAWVRAVQSTTGKILTFNGQVIKPPYFSSDDGRTRTPLEAGWMDYPFAEIYVSKDDHWCKGMTLNGHGVGMSGCGAKGQANEGKMGEQILQYYYPGTVIK